MRKPLKSILPLLCLAMFIGIAIPFTVSAYSPPENYVLPTGSQWVLSGNATYYNFVQRQKTYSHPIYGVPLTFKMYYEIYWEVGWYRDNVGNLTVQVGSLTGTGVDSVLIKYIDLDIMELSSSPPDVVWCTRWPNINQNLTSGGNLTKNFDIIQWNILDIEEWTGAVAEFQVDMTFYCSNGTIRDVVWLSSSEQEPPSVYLFPSGFKDLKQVDQVLVLFSNETYVSYNLVTDFYCADYKIAHYVSNLAVNPQDIRSESGGWVNHVVMTNWDTHWLVWQENNTLDGIHYTASHWSADMLIDGKLTPVRFFSYYNDSHFEVIAYYTNITVGYSEKTGAVVYWYTDRCLSGNWNIETVLLVSSANFQYEYTPVILTLQGISLVNPTVNSDFNIELHIRNHGDLDAVNAFINWSSTVFSGINNKTVTILSEENKTVSFTLTAPSSPGNYSLTIDIYYNNTLHDYATFEITVTEEPEQPPQGVDSTLIAVLGGAAAGGVIVVVAVFKFLKPKI